MTFFNALAAILTVAAIASYINARFLKFPPSVGLLIISLTGSLAILILGQAGAISLDDARRIIESVNFEDVVLNGMLAFLLFAGALHVDLKRLVHQRLVISFMASAGVVLATFITGTLIWLGADWVGLELPYP